MGKLFEDLKRRNVFRIAAVYAVSAWVLIQIADIVLPTFGAPEWVNQTVIFLFILGFIPTLVAAWAYEVTPDGVRQESGSQPSVAPTTSNDRKLIYATFALVLLVAGFQISDRFLLNSEQASVVVESSTTERAVTRVSINIPDDQSFHPVRGDFNISKDGTAFVYQGISASGRPTLWYRRWDELRARPLAGTEFGNRPRFSPDGQEVVFAAQGEIRVVSLASGLSRTLILGDLDSPSWSHDGEWIYFHDAEEGTSRISAQGGDPEIIRSVNPDNGERDYQNVYALPGDKIILYTVRLVDGGNRIHSYNHETGEDRFLIDGKNPIYSNTGHLLFQTNEEPTLFAIAMDSTTLEFTSPAIPLVTDLYQIGGGEFADIGVSETGRMVYRVGDRERQLGIPVWVTREGEVSEIDENWMIPTTGGSSLLHLSPQGDRLVMPIRSGGELASVWIKRLDDGPFSRLTFENYVNNFPVWSADGSRIFYSSGFYNGLVSGIWSKRSDGRGSSERVLSSPEGTGVGEIAPSADGRWLVYRHYEGDSFFDAGDLYAYDLQAGGEPRALVVNDNQIQSPALSPDSQWLAYQSDESGRHEIYVRPFPDADSGRWQVSQDGGTEPVWANNGEELFYRNGSNELVVVSLRAGDTFDWNSQDVLFSMSEFRLSEMRATYDTSADDQRFAMTKLSANEGTELILVDNWMDELP